MGELPEEKKADPNKDLANPKSEQHLDSPLPSSPVRRGVGSDSVTRSFKPQQFLQGLSTSQEVHLGSSSVVDQQKTVISQRPAASPQEFYRQMPLADLAEMLEGKMLDHFYVGQLIGGGGMGAVFRGIDKRLDRVVAIKVIPGSRREPEMLRRFRLEAQAAARLDHPNIARVFYVGEAEHWDYIVFEFIDGINIRDLVDLEGPLSVDDAVFFTRQVAEALEHAHQRAVVHRDIKPSNILVTANGTAKLVDMGLARDTSLDGSTHDQTASGITLGTFDYISPEQARNPRDADVRSDLYSLGCSLFFMLTGHPPFPEGTALQKLLNHGSLPPPDPRGWRDDISDELYQILMKLMAKRPGDRYQKPIDLVNDLLLLAQIDDLPRSQGPSTLAIHPTVAQPTLLECHLPWIVAACFLLGTTVWLQSQSLSSGFALPSISFPEPAFARSVDPANTQRNGVSQVTSPLDGLSEISAGVADARNLFPEAIPSTISPFPFENAGASRPPSSESSGRSANSPARELIGGRLGTAADQSWAQLGSNGRSGLNGGIETVKPEGSSATDASVPGDSMLRADAIPRSGSDGSPLNATSSVIVVSSIPPPDVTAPYWESSLYRAVQRWMNEPDQVAAIEIRGSVWLDRPLEIKGSANSPARLVLRGAENSEAKIEIARGVWSNLTAETGVIRMKDTSLAIENLHVQAIFRESETLPRSIFQLTGNSQFDALQSTFTLECDRPNLVHLFFYGDADTQDSVSSPLGQRDSKSTRIGLNRCLVRGGTSVMRIKQTDPVHKDSIQISVLDSLIAVGGRVLQLQSATGQSSVERMVRLFCEWSTFVSSDGFASLEYFGSYLPLVGFSRTSQSCVFWSRPGVPHITISGESASLQNTPDTLLLQGLNNAYDQNLQVLCQHIVGGVRMKDWEPKDGQLEGWFAERGNDRVVRWQRAIPEMPIFREANWAEFELVSTHFVPGFRTKDSLSP